MKNQQNNTSALSALLRTANGGDTQETNSLCCAAAGIIAPPSATAEALVPHEKLRGAALSDATLIAPARPLAQPALGYMHASNAVDYPPESKPGQRYWPADLADVRPDEWAVMSPKHVAEFAGVTEVWLLLEAAQKRIAELEQINTNLRECAVALNVDSDTSNAHPWDVLIEQDDLQLRSSAAEQSLDKLAWVLAEGILILKDRNPEDATWFAEAEAILDVIHKQGITSNLPLENDAAVEAIQFALENDEGLAFLRRWNEGDFQAIRDEWPEAPEEVFIGADPLHGMEHRAGEKSQ